MNLSGTTKIVVNGKQSCILGRAFNVALRAQGAEMVVFDLEGAQIIPSKELAWSAVAALVRAGKKVQAKTLTASK